MEDKRPITLSVVVPAYNEEARIKKTLDSLDAYLKAKPFRYEILVVDDGSRDRTERVVFKSAESIPHLKLLRHERNHGKGWAVRTGMLQARGNYRLFMDADGSTDIRHWDAMQSALESGADVVVGSRHTAGSSIRVRQAPHREALGSVFRHMVKTMFSLPINDTQNGFKAFRGSAAERIFRRQRVRGWAFDVELLTITKALDYAMVEIPISWIDDDRSRVTFMAMPVMVSDLLRIRLKPIQSLYYGRGKERPTFQPSNLVFEDLAKT